MQAQACLYQAEPPPAFRDFPPLAAGAAFGGGVGGGAGLPGAAAPTAAACAAVGRGGGGSFPSPCPSLASSVDGTGTGTGIFSASNLQGKALPSANLLEDLLVESGERVTEF